MYNQQEHQGAHSGDPEGCKQHIVKAITFRILPQSLSRFVKEGIMKTDWRTRRKRHSLPGHLMKTCLARRRLLDDHQLAIWSSATRGCSPEWVCMLVTSTTQQNEDSLKKRKGKTLEGMYEKCEETATANNRQFTCDSPLLPWLISTTCWFSVSYVHTFLVIRVISRLLKGLGFPQSISCQWDTQCLSPSFN